MAQATYADQNVALAGQGRRLAGFVLDIILFIPTLAIGWIIWYLIVARRGQSPAKQLLGMRVIREDGTVAGLGWMLIRDLVVRGILYGAISGVLTAILGEGAGSPIFSLFWAVSALWCVWDANRQCLWDKVVKTRVVYMPQMAANAPMVGAIGGVGAAAATNQDVADNLRTLAELHDRGLLTDEEYEERRARELAVERQMPTNKE